MNAATKAFLTQFSAKNEKRSESKDKPVAGKTEKLDKGNDAGNAVGETATAQSRECSILYW